MKKYTEADRAALIEFTKQRIEALRFSIKQYAFESVRKPLQSELAVAEIALAALTAVPAAYMYRDKLHSDARFSLYPRFGNWSPEDINEYEITETRLYTTPPVSALALPDEILIHSEMDFVRKEKAKEWNRCLAEVKRLNTNQSQSHEVE